MHKCPCINVYPTSHLCVVLHFLIFVQFMPDGWHVFLYNKLSIQFPIYVFSLKLMRLVIRKYLNLRLKTYGKLYTEFVVQKNMPSIRHELNKTILFRNM